MQIDAGKAARHTLAEASVSADQHRAHAPIIAAADAAVTELIEGNLRLVIAVAKKYQGRGLPLAGNAITAEAITWSVISIIGLLGGTGLVFYLFGRYDWLGWSEALTPVRLRPVEEVSVTPAQRTVVWFLLVSSLLFLLQVLTGGLIAHYRAEPGAFFGFDLSNILPFNILRTWHIQLAIFWVSASYLATGIFIAPLIAGRERRGQGVLTLVLLLAVAMVIFGSLAGEYAGVQGWLGEWLWFWVGHQDWEYLDLGRLWQILLIIGLFLWVFILLRGLSKNLRGQHFGYALQ
jgi:nitric oxide reductase subunit B